MIGLLGNTSTALISVIGAIAGITAVWVGATQRTATYDTVRIQEGDRIFGEFVSQAHDLCNMIVPKDIDDNFYYALTLKYDANVRDKARNRIGYRRIGSPLRPFFYAVMIRELDGDLAVGRPVQQFVKHAVFPTMLRLSNLMQYRVGYKPAFIWNFYYDYNNNANSLNQWFGEKNVGDTVDLSEASRLYFDAQSDCYASIDSAIDGYYSQVEYNKPRIEINLNPGWPLQ